ncbi:MAG: MATE family efflux transporter, partial [Oscillospiraceae bacterium]
EFLMVMFYMHFREKLVNFRMKDLFKFNTTLLGDYMRHSLPVVGNELFWGLGSLAVSVIIGHIGEAFVTANSIADVMNQLTSVAVFGLANAAAVLTGKTIGEGRKKDAQKTANTILALTAFVGLCGSVVLLLLRGPILTLYNVTPEAREITMSLLTVLALLQLPLALDLTTIVGVLRGGGDTKFAFLIDCGCLWGFAVPIGAIGGLVLGLPPALTYVLLRGDTILKCIFGLVRTFSGKWVKDLTHK